MTKRYFIEKDADGTILVLARFSVGETEFACEYLDNGQWVHYAPLVDMLTDPNYGEEITSEEAERIAPMFGDGAI